jgi:hypothetical protein
MLDYGHCIYSQLKESVLNFKVVERINACDFMLI